MIRLIKDDNANALNNLIAEQVDADLIYGDPIYKDSDFEWVRQCKLLLKPNGIFCVQLDDSRVAEMKLFCDSLFGIRHFINWCIVWSEWGGAPRRKFPPKKDHILIYCKGLDYKWYPDRIKIEKATKGSKLDKTGGLKTPCDVFYDISSFSTLDNERIKDYTNHNIRWQKKLSLMNRLFLPFTDENDLIIEPFGGTFSACRWAKLNNRNAIGIELDEEVFQIGTGAVENAG